jgi:hypothetical protein
VYYICGVKKVVIRCPECEEHGRRGAILAKLSVYNGEIELWCRKCRKPIEVEIKAGVIRFTGAKKSE